MTTAAEHQVREYETIYVLSPTTAKEASERIAQRVEEVMGREGGTLTLVENWGRRQLAYPVSKHRRGVYVYLKFTAGSGAVVDELERNFRMLDEVLKFQTVKLREDVDPKSVTVDAEAVKFEGLEPPLEDEAEETLEQQLGLAEPSHSSSGGGKSTDGDQAEAGAAGDSQDAAGAGAESAAASEKKDGAAEEEE